MLYSYDAVEEVRDEFDQLIVFQDFQDEDYLHSIDKYSNDIKQIYLAKRFEQFNLKADTLVLHTCLTNVPLEESLTAYNDIAYYLEQSGAYQEAVFLLRRITMGFPDRTVAHINLGDTYWGMGKLEEAKAEYSIYVAQIKEQDKENRIPKTVFERIQ